MQTLPNKDTLYSCQYLKKKILGKANNSHIHSRLLHIIRSMAIQLTCHLSGQAGRKPQQRGQDQASSWCGLLVNRKLFPAACPHCCFGGVTSSVVQATTHICVLWRRGTQGRKIWESSSQQTGYHFSSMVFGGWDDCSDLPLLTPMENRPSVPAAAAWLVNTRGKSKKWFGLWPTFAKESHSQKNHVYWSILWQVLDLRNHHWLVNCPRQSTTLPCPKK